MQLRVAAPVAYLTLSPTSARVFGRQIQQAGTGVPGDVRVVVVGGSWSVPEASDTADDLADDALTHDMGARDSAPFDWLERPDVISVAALHGPATGAGFALALACDVRIATTDATFALPAIELGRLPAFGALSRLGDELGYARDFELSVSGAQLSADRALRWGLVSSTVASADLDAAVERTVDALLALPRSATAEAKALLKAAAAGSLDHGAESAAARRLARERAGYADG